MTRSSSLRQRLDALVQEMLAKGIRLSEAQDALECRYLVRALADCEDNQTRAAELLEMHRNTLRRKLERHGLS